jgi:hypothetical protein
VKSGPALVKQQKPETGRPLHFTIDGDTVDEYTPYCEVP